MTIQFLEGFIFTMPVVLLAVFIIQVYRTQREMSEMVSRDAYTRFKERADYIANRDPLERRTLYPFLDTHIKELNSEPRPCPYCGTAATQGTHCSSCGAPRKVNPNAGR